MYICIHIYIHIVPINRHRDDLSQSALSKGDQWSHPELPGWSAEELGDDLRFQRSRLLVGELWQSHRDEGGHFRRKWWGECWENPHLWPPLGCNMITLFSLVNSYNSARFQTESMYWESAKISPIELIFLLWFVAFFNGAQFETFISMVGEVNAWSCMKRASYFET